MAHTLSDNARNLLNTMRKNGTVDVTSKVNISVSNETPLVGGNITISWTIDGATLKNLVLSINGKARQTGLGNHRSLSLPIQSDEEFTIQLSSNGILSEAVVIAPLSKVSLMNKNVLKKLALKLMVFSALLFIAICTTTPFIVGLIFGVVAPFLLPITKFTLGN